MLPYTAMATVVGPAGAYVSTASDVARWAHALYSGQVLDQATFATMVDISSSQPYKPRWVYGLGMQETTINGSEAWGHRGHLNGFWSAVWYLPDYGVSIAVLTNADWADPVTFAAALKNVVVT
jgi:CubicO group peptidase (beta-lactamase class C family)